LLRQIIHIIELLRISSLGKHLLRRLSRELSKPLEPVGVLSFCVPIGQVKKPTIQGIQASRRLTLGHEEIPHGPSCVADTRRPLVSVSFSLKTLNTHVR
jgi:hypothetical protein